MSRRRRSAANPAVERRWLTAVQALGLTILVLVTLFLVYKAMTAV